MSRYVVHIIPDATIQVNEGKLEGSTGTSIWLSPTWVGLFLSMEGLDRAELLTLLPQMLPFFELSHQLLVGQDPAGFYTELSPMPLLSLSIAVLRTSQPGSHVSLCFITKFFVNVHQTLDNSNGILRQTLSVLHLPLFCPYITTTAPASVSTLEDILLC